MRKLEKEFRCMAVKKEPKEESAKASFSAKHGELSGAWEKGWNEMRRAEMR